MIEALWSVEFVSLPEGNQGAGVVVIETKRIFGGDSNYFYLGTLTSDKDGDVTANVNVKHYFGDTNAIFGSLKEFTLRLKGKPSEKQWTLFGEVGDNPDRKVAVRLTRLAELP